MTKQVRETTAGAAISAYVVLNKKGEHVATVNAHYSNGGRVSVDVWNHGDHACLASLETALATGRVTEKALAAELAKAPDYYEGDRRKEWAAYQLFGLQQSSAGGYGYDKYAAALAGLIIDGHTIADHCGRVPECEKTRAALLRQYRKSAAAGHTAADRDAWHKKARRLGANFTNWQTTADGCEGFTSLYFEQGLKRLECLGYRVIQAI